MKKLTLSILLFCFSVIGYSQCLTALYGLYPAATFTPTCGATCVFQAITTIGYAGEYSTVNVTSGNTYKFKSSVATDFITIANNVGPAALTSGISTAAGITWIATITGTVRFYTHTGAGCGSALTSRTRSVCCIGVVPAPPANNDCSGATSLTVNPSTPCVTSSSGTTISATSSAAGCSGTADDDVWYSFTATATSHIITVTPGTLSDAVFQVYSGTCAALTSLSCIDATAGTAVETTTLTGLTIGTTYRVRVYSYASGSGQGTFTICVTTPAPSTPPPNDACSAATLLPCATSSLAGTTVSTVSEVAPLGFSSNFGVWYKFTGDGLSTTISSLAGAGFDHEMTIMTGVSCGSYVIVSSQDVGFAGGTETYTFMSTLGTQYYIYIAYYATTGTSANTGTFTISRTCVAPIPITPTTTVQYTASYTGVSPIFSFPATAGCTYIFSTCGLSTADTYLTLYSPTGTVLATSDDYCSLQSQISWVCPTTGTYTIMLNNFGGAPLASATSMSYIMACPPANDLCANATPLTLQCPGSSIATSGTTLAATEEAIADPTCDAGNIQDVWYSFNTGNNTEVDIYATLGTATMLGVQIFSSCGTVATGVSTGGAVGSCDWNILTPSPTVFTGLATYTTYRLRIFTNASWYTPGTFSIYLNTINNTNTLSSAAGTNIQSVCLTNAITTITYTTTGATGAVFSGLPSGLTSNWASNVATISGTPTVTGTFNYTMTLTGGCGTSTATGTITINPLPTLTVSPITICAGASGTLTASGASTYSWSPATGLSATTGSSVTANPATTTTYTVTGTTSGCSSTAVATVTVNPLPVTTVNSPTICAGATATLTAAGATSYAWTTGLSATTGATVTGSPASTTSYTITGTTSGCSSTAVATVTVNPSPTTTISSTVSGVASTTICAGDSATLTAAGASSFVWSTGDLTNPITVTPATTTAYTVTGTSGSCSTTASVTVTVILPVSSTITITGNAVIIAGTSENYSIAPDPNATSYQWDYRESSTTAWVTGISTTTSATVNWPLTTTDGEVLVTVSNTCRSQSQNLLVFVGGVLPIELLYFNGVAYPTFNLLKWATATEQLSDYFEIQESLDGITWRTAGIKPGAGNSNVLTSYSDSVVFNELAYHYYRLKQVDYDGNFKFYDIITLDNTRDSNSADLNAYHNHNGSIVILLNTDASQQYTTVLYDAQGNKVKAQDFESVKGGNIFKLDVSNCQLGVYFLQISNGVKQVSKKIFID